LTQAAAFAQHSEQRRKNDHLSLSLSAQVLLKGPMKLLLGQGTVGDSGEKTEPDWSGGSPGKGQPPTDGWHLANGSWVTATSVGWKCGMAHGAAAVYAPCLFNESTDLREEEDLSLAPANAALLRDMEGQLSREALAAFTSRTPAEMLGKCDATCAKKYWKSLGSTAGNGPICGVPGCS